MPKWFICKTCNVTVWVLAQTASKARYRTLRAAREAGYKVSFADVEVRRDNSAAIPPLSGDVKDQRFVLAH